MQIEPQCRHNMVPVNNLALFADEDGPIRVTIQRDADMRAMAPHRLLQSFRMHGAARVVDVHAVGTVGNDFDFRPEFAQHRRRDLVRRTIGTIHHQFNSLKIEVSGNRPFHKFDVPPLRIADPIRLSDRVRRRPQMFDLIGDDQLLDTRLDLIRQFETFAGEEFNAVVLIRIV